jgi:murein DD-endopeptidase MepM/ murein hydrolase activator NlpD
MAGLLRPSKEDVKIQKKKRNDRNRIKARFYNNKQCGFCDDCWAIDYTHKREFPALHKGTDLPKKFNEPILAMADGTVVGIFQNEFSRKELKLF